MTVEKILFALFRSEICGEILLDEYKNAITPETASALYSISKSHDLAHLVCEALDKNGVLAQCGKQLEEAFCGQRHLAVCRYEQMKYEYARICNAFEEAKIDYIPLKGAIIRAFYPQPWLRTSCDIDILVREEQLDSAVKVLMEKLSYTGGEKDSHDVSLFSGNGVHLELHFKLFDVRISKKGENVLSRAWEYSTPTRGWSHRREMTDEMFYFFHISHMAKHFEAGGCGVRPFIDLWLLNRKAIYKQTKRDQLLQQGALLKFENGAKRLAEVWFLGKGHDECTQKIQDYVLRGGVYGNMENAVAVKQAQKGGKFGYILSRIFVPYEILVIRYPSLKKHKWLVPFYQVRRWGRLLCKGKAKKSVQELNFNSKISEEKQKSAEKLLQDLGL